MLDAGVVAGVVTGVVAGILSTVGYFYRQLRQEIRANSRVRRYLTGEGVEGEEGEITSLDERLEQSREDRHREHEKVWRGIECLYQGQREIVDALESSDKVEADVELPDHPSRYRRDDHRWEAHDD